MNAIDFLQPVKDLRLIPPMKRRRPKWMWSDCGTCDSGVHYHRHAWRPDCHAHGCVEYRKARHG
jgi:hypothetical protein